MRKTKWYTQQINKFRELYKGAVFRVFFVLRILDDKKSFVHSEIKKK